MNQHPLITHIESLHTTPLGVQRIKRNLSICCDDVVAYCKDSILQKHAVIYKQGKTGIVKVMEQYGPSMHIAIPSLPLIFCKNTDFFILLCYTITTKGRWSL